MEPVTIEGTTIDRAILSSLEDLQCKDLRVGDTVELHKSGEHVRVLRVVLEERPENARPEGCVAGSA